jgi:hypothetical protein
MKIFFQSCRPLIIYLQGDNLVYAGVAQNRVKIREAAYAGAINQFVINTPFNSTHITPHQNSAEFLMYLLEPVAGAAAFGQQEGVVKEKHHPCHFNSVTVFQHLGDNHFIQDSLGIVG